MLQIPDKARSEAAKRAWETMRAKKAAREKLAAIAAGVQGPSTAFRETKPVVDLFLADDPAVGSGMRRFIVLDCGERSVRLFCYPKMVATTIDRVTFDQKAKYARDAKAGKLIEIIKRNIALADKCNGAAQDSVLPDGGADAVKAIEVLS